MYVISLYKNMYGKDRFELREVIFWEWRKKMASEQAKEDRIYQQYFILFVNKVI
jgi:hypothetical protein